MDWEKVSNLITKQTKKIRNGQVQTFAWSIIFKIHERFNGPQIDSSCWFKAIRLCKLSQDGIVIN